MDLLNKSVQCSFLLGQLACKNVFPGNDQNVSPFISSREQNSKILPLSQVGEIKYTEPCKY